MCVCVCVCVCVRALLSPEDLKAGAVIINLFLMEFLENFAKGQSGRFVRSRLSLRQLGYTTPPAQVAG